MRIGRVTRRALPAWGAWALVVVLLVVRQLLLVHGLSHPGARVEVANFAGHTVGDLTCEVLDHLGTGDWTPPGPEPLGLHSPAQCVPWAVAREPDSVQAWRRSARGPPQA